VTLTAQDRFTPTGGSETAMASNSVNFNWGPNTSTGSGSSQSVQQNDTLEPYGTGGYRTRQSVQGYCLGTGYNATDKNTSSLSISRPSSPDYTTPGETLAFLGGAGGLYTTANGLFANTSSLSAGAANGATGTFTWDLTHSGSQGTYASLPSCSNCATNEITALHESDSCLAYNTRVRTNYGGFYSEKMYLFIDRPSYTQKPSGVSDTLGNYGPQGFQAFIYYVTWGLCSGQGVLASYSINEEFSTETNSIANNWPHVEGGTALPLSDSIWSDWVAISAASVCLATPSDTCTPVPQNAGSGTTLVQKVDQIWRVGSTIAGSGIVIQRNSLDRYLDHALHSAIVSPSN